MLGRVVFANFGLVFAALFQAGRCVPICSGTFLTTIWRKQVHLHGVSDLLVMASSFFFDNLLSSHLPPFPVSLPVWDLIAVCSNMTASSAAEAGDVLSPTSWSFFCVMCLVQIINHVLVTTNISSLRTSSFHILGRQRRLPRGNLFS